MGVRFGGVAGFGFGDFGTEAGEFFVYRSLPGFELGDFLIAELQFGIAGGDFVGLLFEMGEGLRRDG